MSLSFALLMLFSYFLGAVPFGLLFARAFADLDIRQYGSGNIGATNMNRVLGRKLGAATLLADLLKSLLPVLMAQFFLESALEVALVGLCSILGHCFPIYLKFKGGKGVASTFGVMLGISPPAAGLLFLTWILAFRLSKISAVGALAACLTMPLYVFIFVNFPVALVFVGVSGLVIARHKENITRLWKGKELRSSSEALSPGDHS